MTDRHFSPQQGLVPQASLPEELNSSSMVQRGGVSMPRQQQQQQQQQKEEEQENSGLAVSEEEFRMVQELQAIQAGHEQIDLPTNNRGSLEGEDNDDSDGADDDDEEYDVFKNVGQGLVGHYREIMIRYWQELINEIESTNEPGSEHQDDFKSHSLPFARIRKVMKTDEDVKMISAEAPIIFAKACEIFITELTMRAWCVAERNKRRTLQKADIAEALQKSDMFDFLIDVVPRRPLPQ
ncbi:hypothetical protein SKDZ_15G4900 [Saccharomyces kudriavzevii ZP591]|nr:hypothetical protein SKDZ_15G4900 [Saccharomyces kudriavzevii ZP591]